MKLYKYKLTLKVYEEDLVKGKPISSSAFTLDLNKEIGKKLIQDCFNRLMVKYELGETECQKQ